MIVKMSRYDFVLLSAQSDDFVARLRELGLVDITTTGWEPREQDRQLVSDIEHHRKAVDMLQEFAQSENMQQVEAYPSGAEAFEAYVEAAQRKATLMGEVARLDKLSEELEPWGEFSAESREQLAEGGVMLRYFTTQTTTFDENLAAWGEQYTLAEINRTPSTVYFVVVATADEDIMLDAQEVRVPMMDYRAAKADADENRLQIQQLDYEFSRCAASLKAIKAELAALTCRLQNVKIRGTAEEAADGELMVMEGWAEADKSAEVDKLLDEYPDVIYLKSKPTEQDDTPVK